MNKALCFIIHLLARRLYIANHVYLNKKMFVNAFTIPDCFTLKSGFWTLLPDRPKTAMKGPITEEPSAPVKPILQKTWVDLDDFAKCFQWDTCWHKYVLKHCKHTVPRDKDSCEKRMVEGLKNYTIKILMAFLCFVLSRTLLVFHQLQIYPHHSQKSHFKVWCISWKNPVTSAYLVSSAAAF